VDKRVLGAAEGESLGGCEAATDRGPRGEAMGDEVLVEVLEWLVDCDLACGEVDAGYGCDFEVIGGGLEVFM
jgi:hypothetical protein